MSKHTTGDLNGKPMHISMQYFAEGDPTPPAADPNPPAQGSPATPTFDDILKDKTMQSEFDKRVAKALETQKIKLSEDYQKTMSEKLSEAEKLAKMSADQKAEYARKQAEENLAKREAEINKRELTATAKETLISKGLPVELHECLNYADAEACNASIEAISKAFEVAISKAVDSRLKQNPPPAGATNTGTDPFLEGFGSTK